MSYEDTEKRIRERPIASGSMKAALMAEPRNTGKRHA